MADTDTLDGNTFFLYSKEYPYARITYGGFPILPPRKALFYACKPTEVISFSPKELWLLEEEPRNPGYYYIFTLRDGEDTPYGARISMEKDSDILGLSKEKREEEDLWKPVREQDEYYRFLNFKFGGYKFCQKDREDKAIYVQDGLFHPNQLWKLVPRYEALIKEETIWEADNREGSQDFSEKVIVTTGTTVMHAQEFKKRFGFKRTTQRSLSAAFKGMDLTAQQERQLMTELESTTSSADIKEWSVTREITFTAPAGKWYKVSRFSTSFDSLLTIDNLVMKSQYKIREEDKLISSQAGVFPGTLFDGSSSTQD